MNRSFLTLVAATSLALPAHAEENAAVTDIQIEQTFTDWPAIIATPSIGIGSGGVHVGVRVATDNLLPGIYTETQLRISNDFGFFDTPIEQSSLFPTVHNATGLRQRVGLMWHGVGPENVPVQHAYNESFTVEIPARTVDAIYGSVEARPFASSKAAVAIFGLGYLHGARFDGKVDYRVRGESHSVESSQNGYWTVEPRVMLNTLDRPIAPGLAFTFVYNIMPLFGFTTDVALYYGKGFDAAGFTTQDNYFGDVFFEYSFPIDIDSKSVTRFFSPASGPTPAASSNPSSQSVPPADAVETEQTAPPASAAPNTP